MDPCRRNNRSLEELDIQWMNNKYYEYDTDENDEQTFDFMDAS
jgi:hypothetical protein